MKSAIKAESVSKTYKTRSQEKQALIDFSLNIPQGSFFGLLGPNGAGKSTFINILAGIITKTQGKIEVCGLDIDQHPRNYKYSIGVVPQEIVIDPFFTVKEMLEFYSGYYGIRRKNYKVAEICDALSLTDKLNSAPRALSGGMRRRLLIAKALVHNPRVLILDEPTAGVDIELREQLWQYVRKLNKNGTTIVLTTHYLEEAEALCDDIAIINNGKLLACDKKENLMKTVGMKRLEVKFEDNVNNFEALSKYNYEKLNENTIAINYHVDKEKMSDIIDKIQLVSRDIADIRTIEPDLQDVFRHFVSL